MRKIIIPSENDQLISMLQDESSMLLFQSSENALTLEMLKMDGADMLLMNAELAMKNEELSNSASELLLDSAMKDIQLLELKANQDKQNGDIEKLNDDNAEIIFRMATMLMGGGEG